jgi:hypothetical protein
VGDSLKKAGNNAIYSNEGERGLHTQSLKPGGGKLPPGNINKAGAAAGWIKFNGKSHVEYNNPKTAEDGMEQYSANVGHIDVRFMCGNEKGFNLACWLKQFIAAACAVDKELWMLPLGGQDNNLCIPADVPTSKDGIQKYARHRVAVNNIACNINIQTKFYISQFKHPSSSFR